MLQSKAFFWQGSAKEAMATTVKTHWILSVAPAWVPDEDVTNCYCCDQEFSFFKRKVRLCSAGRGESMRREGREGVGEEGVGKGGKSKVGR